MLFFPVPPCVLLLFPPSNGQLLFPQNTPWKSEYFVNGKKFFNWKALISSCQFTSNEYVQPKSLYRRRAGSWEVSPVEQDTIYYKYLAYFVPKKIKRIQKFIFIEEILCNFLMPTLQCLKKTLPLKTWKNCPQNLLIIGPNCFFSPANRPKTSPNLIFCSIKMRDF